MNANGTSTGILDALEKFKEWAEDNGWTTDAWITAVAGERKWFGHSPGGSYYSMGAFTSGGLAGYWASYANTSYNGAADYNAQPNRSNAIYCDLGVNPFSGYWAFGDEGENLSMVIEVTTNVFRHITVGKLEKSCVYTGGEYISATRWNGGNPQDPFAGDNQAMFDGLRGSNAPSTELRCEIDGHRWFAGSNWNAGEFTPGNAEYRGEPNLVCPVRGGMLDGIVARSPNTFNSLNVLASMTLYAARPSNLLSPLGVVPRIRYVNIANLNPKEELAEGGDTWIIFPLAKKGTAAHPNPASGDMGYAYLKD